MATVIQLPRLSDTMEEGVVASWKIKPGDKVKRGQVIADIETDKATMEFESFDPGVVLKLIASEGEPLPIGAPIAVLGKAGEDPAAALAELGSASPPSAEPAATQAADAPSAPPTAPPTVAVAQASGPATSATTVDDGPPSVSSDRVPASPLARRVAREHSLDLGRISGSGPHGRVIKSDVDRAIAAGGTASAPSASAPTSGFSTEVDQHGRPYASRPNKTVKHTQMRKTIARRMLQSQTEVPHFYLTIDIDMEAAAKVRADYNLAVSGTKVSYNDFLISAVAKALRAHPRCNATFRGDHIEEHGDIHMGVAVALDDGLVVPVVRYADQKTLDAISREIRDLGKRAKAKALQPNEMSGSTFTISNLGMFGIDEFAAMVNPGEGGILAVGSVSDKACVVDGELVVRKRMKATLSCDHRVIDGAVGAQLLATLREYLENPMRLFT